MGLFAVWCLCFPPVFVGRVLSPVSRSGNFSTCKQKPSNPESQQLKTSCVQGVVLCVTFVTSAVYRELCCVSCCFFFFYISCVQGVVLYVTFVISIVGCVVCDFCDTNFVQGVVLV